MNFSDAIFSGVDGDLGANAERVFQWADFIKEKYEIVKDFAIAKTDDQPLRGEWTGYVDKEKKIGAVIVENEGELKIVAIAHFANNYQLICEIDPDGLGDRLTYSALTDTKFMGLKKALI